MASPWLYVDILVFFPTHFKDGTVYVEVEGRLMTRDAVVQKWTEYCSRPWNDSDPKPKQSARVNKGHVVRVLLEGKQQGNATATTADNDNDDPTGEEN